MQRTSFNSFVIIPISTLIGLGIGVQLCTSQFPAQMVSSAIASLIALWIVLAFIMTMVDVVHYAFNLFDLMIKDGEQDYMHKSLQNSEDKREAMMKQIKRLDAKAFERARQGVENTLKWPEAVGAALAVADKLPAEVMARVQEIIYGGDITEATRNELRTLLAPYDSNPANDPH